MKRARTAKERVLRKRPMTYAYKWPNTSFWTIYYSKGLFRNIALGEGRTAATAWADAARRIGAGR